MYEYFSYSYQIDACLAPAESYYAIEKLEGNGKGRCPFICSKGGESHAE